MPRGLRVDAPGMIHHVTFRGVERRSIFCDDRDRRELLGRTDCLVRLLHFRCFAWVFMTNHVHLVLETGDVPLPRLMARLGTGYVLYFNRRHNRVGHLWQDRYWSRPLEEDLETVVEYVHSNPVRAGMVPEECLSDYPWCGHGGVVGSRPRYAFESPCDEESASRVRSQSVVVDVDETAANVSQMLDEICLTLAISRGELLSTRRTRRVSAARELVAKRLVLERGVRAAVVAKALHVTEAAVSNMLTRGA